MASCRFCGVDGAQAPSVAKALGMLAAGHLLAMLAILLPFSIMTTLLIWETELRIGAGLLVIAMGIYLLINRQHPKFLARVHPARLALWSFLAAMAHGAGLMLVPIYLGICAIDRSETGHLAASSLMSGNIGNALIVALVHTLAMTLGWWSNRHNHLLLARSQISLQNLVQFGHDLGIEPDTCGDIWSLFCLFRALK